MAKVRMDEPVRSLKCRERLDRVEVKNIGPATIAAQERGRFGEPVLVSPRLGQGSFRLLVTDAYGYRCAMTSERTLPVLKPLTSVLCGRR